VAREVRPRERVPLPIPRKYRARRSLGRERELRRIAGCVKNVGSTKRGIQR